MEMLNLLEYLIMSGLLVSMIALAFKIGKKDEKVDAHELKIKEHSSDIRELKETNNDVKAKLASIDTNIIWIKEKLAKGD